MSKTHRYNDSYAPKRNNKSKLYLTRGAFGVWDDNTYCHGHKSSHKSKQIRAKQLRAKLKVETNKMIINENE